MPELKYDRTQCSRRDYDADVDQGREDRRFGVRDRLGREIGGQARKFRATYIAMTEAERETRRSWNCLQSGTHFAFRPHATRDGRSYGALQSERFFTSEAERDAAVEKYFRDAAKRAVKRAGK